MNPEHARASYIPAQVGGAQKPRSYKLKERAIGGAKSFAVIFLYLFLVFALFNIHEYIVLKQHDIEFAHYGFALVNAFIMAKVMLVAEELRLGSYFDRYPLIYPILVKSCLFAMVLIAFHVIEDVIVGVWHGQTVVDSIPGIGGGGFIGVIAVSVIISVTLIPFFTLRAIIRMIGGDQLYTLTFLRGPKDVVVEVKSRLPTGAEGSKG